MNPTLYNEVRFKITVILYLTSIHPKKSSIIPQKYHAHVSYKFALPYIPNSS